MEASTAKVAPQEAGVFAGRWYDSLGNDVHVEDAVNADSLTVTLTKQGWTKTVKLFFDSRWQCWRCGNGWIRELRYQEDPVKGRALQLISWMTKDRRVSTWKRADEGPSSPEAKVPTAPQSEKEPADVRVSAKGYEAESASAPPARTPPTKDSEASGVAESPAEAPADGSQASGVSTEAAAPSRKVFKESWYEVTEEWDEEQKISSGAKEKEQEPKWKVVDKSLWTISEAPNQRNAQRSGRRRPGRGSRT